MTDTIKKLMALADGYALQTMFDYANKLNDKPTEAALAHRQVLKDELVRLFTPLTDEQIEALKRAHQEAMYRTGSTRIPECGWFGAIAQDLDFVLHGITGESK